jgi:hypothetical protein
MSGPTNPAGLSFTAPTTYTDGTTMPAGEVTSFDYGYGIASANYTRVVNDTVMKTSGGKIAAVIPVDLAIGTWFAAARSRTKDGAVSAWGNEVSFAVAAKTPSPISDFSAA